MNNDFFALFDLPPQFDMDLPKLESRYIELQNQLHPDRFAAKSGQEKLTAQGRAVDVNTAYQTLKNPLARAGYLLRLAGLDFDMQKEKTIFDQELLIDMMARREELEEINSMDDWQKLAHGLNLEISQNYKTLSAQLDAKKWADAQAMMLRQQYLQKMLTEVRQKQSDYLDGAA